MKLKTTVCVISKQNIDKQVLIRTLLNIEQQIQQI